jgi:hypothetical protein
MKRLHRHVGGDDLAASVGFYSTLFAAPPTVQRADHAKSMLDNSRINFAILNGHAARGIEHVGIEVEEPGELAEMRDRLARTGAPVLDEAATTCCLARSSKAWISDPQGVVRETLLTTRAATDHGASPELARLATGASATQAGAARGQTCVKRLIAWQSPSGTTPNAGRCAMCWR